MSFELPDADTPEVEQMVKQNKDHLYSYNICVGVEQAFIANQNKRRYSRILGFLLLSAPPNVRAEVSKCIDSCENEEDVAELGAFFELYFIKPFLKNRGRTPATSNHPSRPDFDTLREQMSVDISQAPKNHREAKVKALLRDNWSCVLTDIVHPNPPKYIDAKLSPSQPEAYTECAHIIPESLFFDVDHKDYKRNYSASVLAVFNSFGYDLAYLNGENIHSLINVMTMEHNVHDAFDRLQLYLEATPKEHCYKIKYLRSRPLPGLQKRSVTFSTSDPKSLPVPAPELLLLHATCCKVAYLSGAGEHIIQAYGDADDMNVLASDGTSGDTFSYILSSLPNEKAI